MSTTAAARKKARSENTGSRIDAYSYLPHEVTLITDKKDPLYDDRVEDPISNEAVLDFAAHGSIQPIVVRRRGSDVIVTVGRQRTKRGLVINDLVGKHAYRGSIVAVMETIRRIRADKDLLKAIIAVSPGGVRLPAMLRNAGTDVTVLGVMTSENEFREDDPLERRIRRAQRLAELGMPVPEIAAKFKGVHRTTVSRWLKTSLSAPAPKKDRAKRPNSRQIKELVERIKDKATPRELALLNWIDGGGELPKVFAE